MLAGLRKIAKGEANIDFVGRARTWFLVSAIVLVASVLGLTVRGFNLGIEFKGGTQFAVPIPADVTVTNLRDAIRSFGLGEAVVQTATESTGQRTASVRVPHIESPDVRTQVQTALAQAAGLTDSSGQLDPNQVSVTDVGPNWGRQISNKALRGLIVFLVLVVFYISFRFELKMAAAALIALFHDLIATAGIYALVGLTVTPATVIALLTLLGYSLYDTVVVFDRVRENTETMMGGGRTTFSQMVNRSVNQVLMRSLNTSLTSLLPVGALLFVGAFLLGAATLEDLALALFIGIMVGTYSSIFVASPILALWKEREPRYQQLRARAASGGGGRVTAPAPVPAKAGGSQAGAEPAAGSGNGSGGGTVATDTRPRPARPGGRPPPRGRKRRGGKRRR